MIRITLLISGLFFFVFISFSFAAGKILPFDWDVPKNPVEFDVKVSDYTRVPDVVVPVTAEIICRTDGKDACSDSEVRKYLHDNGIEINKEECTAAKKTDCTSLGNIRTQTIDQIIELKRNCKCDFRITGGTEAHTKGEFSHANGYKYDATFSESSKLNKYIIDNCTAENNCVAGWRGSERKYTYTKDGRIVEYVNEKSATGGPHWDVTVRPAQEAPKISDSPQSKTFLQKFFRKIGNFIRNIF